MIKGGQYVDSFYLYHRKTYSDLYVHLSVSVKINFRIGRHSYRLCDLVRKSLK